MNLDDISQKWRKAVREFDEKLDPIAQKFYDTGWLKQKGISAQFGIASGIVSGALVFVHPVLALLSAGAAAVIGGRIAGKSGMINQREDMQTASATLNALILVSTMIAADIGMMEYFDYHERRDAAAFSEQLEERVEEASLQID